MKRSSLCRSIVVVSLLTFFFILPAQKSAIAAVSWLSPVSGNWSDGTKWSDGVPSSGDDVLITVDGTYPVTLDVNATVQSLGRYHCDRNKRG